MQGRVKSQSVVHPAVLYVLGVIGIGLVRREIYSGAAGESTAAIAAEGRDGTGVIY
jgi:hypothetical protein